MRTRVCCASFSSNPQLVMGGWMPRPEEAERCFAQDHAGNRNGGDDEDVAHEYSAVRCLMMIRQLEALA